MIKLSSAQLFNPKFQKYAQGLLTYPFSGETAYKARKILKGLSDLSANTIKEYKETVLDKYCKPEGDEVPLEGKEEAFQIAKQEFAMRQHTLDLKQIPEKEFQEFVKSLRNVTVLEIESLESILQETPSVEPGVPSM